MNVNKKDIVMIIVALVIFLIAGALLYRYLAPPSKDDSIKVEIPHPVESTFNQDQLKVLNDDVRDYTQDITPDDTGNTTKPIIQ